MALNVDTNTTAVLSIYNPITGQYIDYDMVKELEVNENTLEQDMITHASKYAYFSSIANKADNYERAAEDALDIALAKADITVRNNFASNGVPKPTVGQVNSAISLDQGVIDAKNKLSEAKGYAGTMKYILKAFDARKDLLINVSAQRRKEMDMKIR